MTSAIDRLIRLAALTQPPAASAGAGKRQVTISAYQRTINGKRVSVGQYQRSGIPAAISAKGGPAAGGGVANYTGDATPPGKPGAGGAKGPAAKGPEAKGPAGPEDMPVPDPEDLKKSTGLFKGSKYVSPDKLPFLQRLAAKLGIDPSLLQGPQGRAMRRRLFRKIAKLEDVKLGANLVTTLENINMPRAKEIAASGGATGESTVQVVKFGGKDYVMSGHHVLAAAALNHQTSVPALVVDLGKGKLGPPEKNDQAPEKEPAVAKLARVEHVRGHVRRGKGGKIVHVSAYTRTEADLRKALQAAETRSIGAGQGGRSPEVEKIKGELKRRFGVDIDKERAGSKKSAPQGTKENPYVTDDVTEAAAHLGKGEYVELKQPRAVSTLLDKLSEMVHDAESKGEKAPTYDLCKVTVENTNLFCVESKGIPRVKMPQLSGTPRPGSKADKFPKNKYGEVDLSEEFAKFLATQGTKVTKEKLDAKYLRASQNEINGAKVATIAKAVREKGYDQSREIWASNDDYVIDGHHRWAAVVGVEYGDNKAVMVPVRRVDLDIITILRLANQWTAEVGLKSASVEDQSGSKAVK